MPLLRFDLVEGRNEETLKKLLIQLIVRWWRLSKCLKVIVIK
ncbi:UNVERIFIED_ORG: hypothetical protein QFZ59_000834 [Bacillus sp. B2I3]|nr:hypothetical protein [Bacillus sp. B2I3]